MVAHVCTRRAVSDRMPSDAALSLAGGRGSVGALSSCKPEAHITGSVEACTIGWGRALEPQSLSLIRRRSVMIRGAYRCKHQELADLLLRSRINDAPSAWRHEGVILPPASATAQRSAVSIWEASGACHCQLQAGAVTPQRTATQQSQKRPGWSITSPLVFPRFRNRSLGRKFKPVCSRD
jgi:hypothetical protein